MLLTESTSKEGGCVMKYNFGNKVLNIPDEEIENLMDTLELTEEEAIETWLDDNDYTENEEVEKLTKKAKENGVKIRGESDAPKAKRVVERKANPTKEKIIADLAVALKGVDGMGAIKVTNIGKLIEFECDGKMFKLDLVERRAPKGGK